MCDVKGCVHPGEWAPQIVTRIRDRITRKEWTIPITVSLAVCSACRETIKAPTDVLDDGGARAIERLLAMRSTAMLVSKALGWVRTDSKEYRELAGSRPS